MPRTESSRIRMSDTSTVQTHFLTNKPTITSATVNHRTDHIVSIITLQSRSSNHFTPIRLPPLTSRQKNTFTRQMASLQQQDYPADKAPLLQDADEDEFDEEPLGRTAIDHYGRRSMAFRVKKTGQTITSTGKYFKQPPMSFFG